MKRGEQIVNMKKMDSLRSTLEQNIQRKDDLLMFLFKFYFSDPVST